MHTGARLYGKAPFELFLIHGGPGAAGSMRPLAEMLAGSNSKASRAPGIVEAFQTQHSIDSVTLELRHHIELYSATRPVTLIGHSWGAWLAILYATRYPADVRRIILISTPPFEVRYADMITTRREARLDAEQRTAFKRAFATLESCEGHTPQQQAVLLEVERLTNISDNVEASSFINDMPFDAAAYTALWPEAVRLRNDGRWHDILRTIECPATVIHGREDPHPAEGVTEPLTRACVEFDAHILDRCGHTPFLERHAATEVKQIIQSSVNSR